MKRLIEVENQTPNHLTIVLYGKSGNEPKVIAKFYAPMGSKTTVDVEEEILKDFSHVASHAYIPEKPEGVIIA